MIRIFGYVGTHLAPFSTSLAVCMYQQRCPLFWRDACQTYFILINPPYWFSKMDLSCIINIGFLVPIHWIVSSIISLTHLTCWSIPRDPGLLWLYLTQCWGMPQLFLCMESPNWNHRSCFNFLLWAFPLECTLHMSLTYILLQMLRNNPRQTLPLSRVRSHSSSSIAVSFTCL